MPTLKSRTTLANGASSTVVTDAYQNIVVNVVSGQASVEAIMDSAESTGYKFNAYVGAAVVAAAYSLKVTGEGPSGCDFEVYAP